METLYLTAAGAATPTWSSTTSTTEWTREENKQFESALAIFGDETPDRWIKVASMIPGKTVFDVMKQYRELEEDVSNIEAGRVPIPGYLSLSFAGEFVDQRDFEGCRKKGLGGSHERKKGVPWTEDEHRRFLMGLVKYGKGDWRNISRNFVISKTPTQVASHAQKYYIRQHSGGKDNKRRPSIHDITTVNLPGTNPVDDHNPPFFDQSNNAAFKEQKFSVMPKLLQDWNNPHVGGYADIGSTQGNLFVPSHYDIASKLHGQNLYGAAAYYRAHVKPENSVF
ncbi:hypothetical protein ACFE04_030402 [Oxalis oulophora]